MRIGRIVDRTQPTGAPGWAIIDQQAETAQPLNGGVADWFGAAIDATLTSGSDPVQLAEFSFAPPLQPGARVFGVGANYPSHLARLGATAPDDPIAYIKPDSAIIGHEEEIRYPPTTQQLDYEVEIVVLVGRPLAGLADPLDAVVGYTLGNDISARDAKAPYGGPDLFGMKALDRSSPVGPWITRFDERTTTGQPSIDFELRVDGEVRQRDNSASMIFSIARILTYLDVRVALRAGDLIFTGTTCGVGLEDGRFLQPGQVVECEAEGLGTLRNVVGPRSIG